MDTDDDDGWRGTIVFEPLTAIAGGLVGGIIVTVIAWRAVWRAIERDMTTTRRGAHA